MTFYERFYGFRALSIIGKCTSRHLFAYGGLWCLCVMSIRSNVHVLQTHLKPTLVANKYHSSLFSIPQALDYMSLRCYCYPCAKHERVRHHRVAGRTTVQCAEHSTLPGKVPQPAGIPTWCDGTHICCQQ